MNVNLKFVGRGSAFNPKEINTSAFLEDDHTILLIDCGGTVFPELINRHILCDSKKVYLIITHTHADHVGGIGNLVLYSYYHLHQKTHIILPYNELSTLWLRKNIASLLEIYGCHPTEYEFLHDTDFTMFDSRLRVKLEQVDHDLSTPSFGINFNFDGHKFFYTGDTNNNRIARDKLNAGFEKVFCDCSNDASKKEFHAYLGDIASSIDASRRHQVCCMHFENDEAIQSALELGFDIAKTT